MGSNHLTEHEPRMYESILLFAKRHDIIPYEAGANSVTDLKRFLDHTKAKGISKTWIEIGPKKEGLTIKEFVEEPEKRKATLKRFRDLAQTYKTYYPDNARVTIFDEAPLGAFARDPQNKNYRQIFSQFKTYAPKAFSLLYNAFKEEFPQAEVGIFLHHPHNASPEMAGKYSYIKSFMQRTDSLGATPDFIYSDVYRGYFNRGYGQEATDRYITDVVSYTTKVAQNYGAEAFQLGQSHTIKLGYTPSQRQIDTNVEAMLEGNPDGIGWYWPNYAGTNTIKGHKADSIKSTEVDVSFNPFGPNNWGKIGPAGSLYGTSRDRFSYAYLRMLEATGKINPEESFDLWIYGHDFDHVEHAVYLKTKNGWQLIGHINPQQDDKAYEEKSGNQFRYSYNNRWHAVLFRALPRDNYFSGDSLRTLQIKITSAGSSDGSKLSGIYAMPYHQTRHFMSEQKATELIEQQPRWVAINSLASQVLPLSFNLRSDSTFIGTLTENQPSEGSKVFQQYLDSLNSNN